MPGSTFDDHLSAFPQCKQQKPVLYLSFRWCYWDPSYAAYHHTEILDHFSNSHNDLICFILVVLKLSRATLSTQSLLRWLSGSLLNLFSASCPQTVSMDTSFLLTTVSV